MKWTKPYYGVSHLETGRTGRPQFTIAEYDRFTEATHFTTDGGFTRNIEETFFGDDSVAKAKAWLEKQASVYE